MRVVVEYDIDLTTSGLEDPTDVKWWLNSKITPPFTGISIVRVSCPDIAPGPFNFPKGVDVY